MWPTAIAMRCTLAGTIRISNGGVCSNDDVTPCTIANQSSDCGGSNSCLIAPQIPWHPIKGSFEIAFYALASNTSCT